MILRQFAPPPWTLCATFRSPRWTRCYSTSLSQQILRPQVRLEAAFALGFRKTSLESFNSQKKALATESDDESPRRSA